MENYLPYIVTVLCAFISGFASYFAARRQSKVDMQKLEKQYELDIAKEREKFAMEKEKLELEHRNQLELKQKEMESQLGANLTNTLMAEVMKMPEVRQQLTQSMKTSGKRNK